MHRTLTTEALIAAIPGLIGFVPAESIVVIGAELAVTARHNIAETAVAAEIIAEALRTNNIPSASVVAISENIEVADAAAGTMGDTLVRHGIETDHRILIPRCDQPAVYHDLIAGEFGVSGDYRDSFASAARVAAGAPIVATRDAVRDTLATTDPITTHGVELQPDLAAKAVVSAMVHWPTEVPRELSAQVAAMIGHHPVYRDAFLRTAAYNPRSAAAVFTELSRPLRGRDRANVLTLAAACHYISGNGAMAGIIFDHIAETDALPSLAKLLNQSLQAGTHPHRLAGMIPAAETVDELFGGHFPTPNDV